MGKGAVQLGPRHALEGVGRRDATPSSVVVERAHRRGLACHRTTRVAQRVEECQKTPGMNASDRVDPFDATAIRSSRRTGPGPFGMRPGCGENRSRCSTIRVRKLSTGSEAHAGISGICTRAMLLPIFAMRESGQRQDQLAHPPDLPRHFHSGHPGQGLCRSAAPLFGEIVDGPPGLGDRTTLRRGWDRCAEH